MVLHDDMKTVVQLAQYMATEIWHQYLLRTQGQVDDTKEQDEILLAAMQQESDHAAYMLEEEDPFLGWE